AGVWLMACAPKSEPATPVEATPSPPATAAPAPSETARPADPAPPADPTPPADPASAAEPAGPSIRDLCYAMCDKFKAKCPQSAFESCRLNCTKYDPPPSGCDAAVETAL